MLTLRKRDADARAKAKNDAEKKRVDAKGKASSGRSITEASLEFGEKALKAKKTLEGLNKPDENAPGELSDKIEAAPTTSPLRELMQGRIDAYQDSARIAQNLEKLNVKNFDAGVEFLNEAKRAVAIEYPRIYAEAYQILSESAGVTENTDAFMRLKIQRMAKEAAEKRIKNEYGYTRAELQDKITAIEGK